MKPADILCAMALMVALIGCSAGFVHGIDRQQEYNDRAELINCQSQGPGWAKSCRHWQQIAHNYQPTNPNNSMEVSRGN